VPRVTIENWLAILRKGPFVDEIFVLVLATLIAIAFVISIGRLDLSNQPKLIEPIPVLGPLNVIIWLSTSSESYTLCMALSDFGRRLCWAFASALSRGH
jgi:hypothetical protein